MSVVLPCAFEGNYAERTVDSLYKHTNWRLKEVIVVDDGSTPPLSSMLPARLLTGSPPQVRLLRHNKTLGLIAAKRTGGNAATSDIIVFFDCHIKPRDGWEESFVKQMKRKGDHRTVVVPTITSLNPDTWEEEQAAQSKACYTLWNADFTWLANPGRDVPLMSGGLLALTRKWWDETGGYDEHMVAWGGENIDQSIRTWLCGGRIEVAEGAYVAHMWRVANNPKTRLHYPIPTEDVMRNKGRAVSAWFGDFKEKAFSFPEYRQFVNGEHSLGSFDNFDKLKERQKCAPMSSYIQRFSYVYVDGGLIPPEVFQIREESTGLCLERAPRDAPPHGVILAPCSVAKDESALSPPCTGCISSGTGGIFELQLWHPSSRDRKKPGAPCCSGIANWNFLQCLTSYALGKEVQTIECDVSGYSVAQGFSLATDKNALQWHGGEACVVPVRPSPPAKKPEGPASTCDLQAVDAPGGGADERRFRLRSGILCLTHDGGSEAKGTDQSFVHWQLLVGDCDESNAKQVFHTKRAASSTSHVMIGVGTTDQCLDAAGGNQLLIYPCYTGTVANDNQLWLLQQERLVWEAARAFCVDVLPAGHAVTLKELPLVNPFVLKYCKDKAGQRLKRHDPRDDGTFLLRDADSGECMAGDRHVQGGPLETRLLMRECSESVRWRELADRNQVQFVALGYCIDAGNGGVPILYPCHTPKAGRKQQFRVADDGGSVQFYSAWEDNGRKRYFPQCLDHIPDQPTTVKVAKCSEAERSGVRWTRANIIEPIEHRLWQKADKPAPGALPLGGDAAPP